VAKMGVANKVRLRHEPLHQVHRSDGVVLSSSEIVNCGSRLRDVFAASFRNFRGLRFIPSGGGVRLVIDYRNTREFGGR
jgi:hypothetical protein